MSSPHVLMPRDRHDFASLTHLQSLGPSAWAPLIPPSAPDAGLLHWLQDMNWPIARPVSQLLVSLADDADARTQYGHHLVDAVKKLFASSEDWGWVHHVLVYVVCEIADEDWGRDNFRSEVWLLRKRVPEYQERDWGFEEYIGTFLGEDGV